MADRRHVAERACGVLRPAWIQLSSFPDAPFGLGGELLVDVVALPAGFLFVDLHVERQCELACSEDRIEMVGEHAENMLAGLLAGGEIAPLAKPQDHVEKTVLRSPVGDGVMLATDGADANAAERKNPGFDRGPAYRLDDPAHIDVLIEVGRIFKGEMRHVRTPPTDFSGRHQVKQRATVAHGPSSVSTLSSSSLPELGAGEGSAEVGE